MVPTLFGRIQTRVFLLAVVDTAITAAITPLLPVDAPLGARYRVTFLILATVTVTGIGWELIYHLPLHRAPQRQRRVRYRPDPGSAPARLDGSTSEVG